LDFTLILAARAFFAGTTLLRRIGKYIARLGFALAGTLLLLGTAQAEVMTSAPETICGRCLRTDSRTFSSWRNQSRAPRENRSYHFAASAGLSLSSGIP
jgi:hypothetical protein